jgi:hypothetical protein
MFAYLIDHFNWLLQLITRHAAMTTASVQPWSPSTTPTVLCGVHVARSTAYVM